VIQPATPGGAALAHALAGFLDTEVTFLRSTKVKDDFGEAVPTWLPLVDYESVMALVAGGDVSVRMKKQEFRTGQATYEVDYRRLLFEGRLTGPRKTDRVRFHDRDWAIVSIVPDPTSAFTEILVQDIEPGDI